MCGLYIDYNVNTVEHMCSVVGIVHGHMPVMWNVYMPVVMVAVSTALSSYDADTLV